MVQNLWKNTVPCCANHLPQKVVMQFEASGKNLIYKCTECKNQISASDFEKILDSISKICVTRSRNSEWGKIDSEKFMIRKHIKCEVLEQTDDEKYYVSILNLKTGGPF